MDKPEDQYKFIYYATLIASIGGFLVGYSTVLIAGPLLYIQSALNISITQQEVLISSALLAAIFGAFLGGLTCSLMGRKTSILISGVIFIISSILALFSAHYPMLIISRIFVGVAAGMCSMAVPFYISEIVPTNIRGSCVCMTTLIFYLGIFSAYSMDTLLSLAGGWTLVLASPIIPAIGMFVGMLYMPETPQWLLSHNKEEAARNSLSKFRRVIDVEGKLEAIEESAGRNLLTSLKNKGVLKALLIGFSIAFFMEITGAEAIFYYVPSVLHSSGTWSKIKAIDASIYMGLVGFLTAIVSILLIDWQGRRRLLLIGTSIAVCGLITHGYTHYISSGTSFNYGLALSSFLIIACGFVLGFGSVGSLLISEIFPLKIRSFSIAIAITIKWFINYLVARFFLTELVDFGAAATFWIFAAIAIISLVFIYFFVPETAGKSLEEIEAHWIRNESRESF